MAGYVAVAVLGMAEIQLERPAAGRSPRPPAPVAGVDLDSRIEDVRVVRSLASGELRERLAAARRVWDQTTFYLFDPHSWL